MKQHIIHIIAALILTACSAAPVADTIDAARRDIDLGNPDRAAAAVSTALSQADTIPVAHLLDISILLIQASEETGNEEYIAQAARCYRQAFARDSVATQAYLDTLSPDHTPRAMLLEQLRLALPR